MKFIFLFGIAIVICIKANGQENFSIQYKLIKTNIGKQSEILRQHDFFDHEKKFNNDTFFIDYILRKYSSNSKLKNFISNRYYLKKFTDVTLKQNIVRLSIVDKDTIEINIEKKYVNLVDLGVIQYDSADKFRYVKSVNNKTAYGYAFDTTVISKIQSISIKINEKEAQIEDIFINDLYFPNFCEVDYAIKPIEAFLSSDKRYIYLYIFGGQDGQTYFCKIIFDMMNKLTIGRMIAEGKELEAYQCLYPKTFIGF